MHETYARALWQVIEKGVAHTKAVRALAEILVREGRAALLPRVARAYERIASREKARNTVKIFVALANDVRAKKEAKESAQALGVRPEEMDLRVDETLIGGWRIEGRGKVMDVSFKNALLNVYNRATNQI